jgi:hypothetical protein
MGSVMEVQRRAFQHITQFIFGSMPVRLLTSNFAFDRNRYRLIVGLDLPVAHRRDLKGQCISTFASMLWARKQHNAPIIWPGWLWRLIPDLTKFVVIDLGMRPRTEVFLGNQRI